MDLQTVLIVVLKSTISQWEVSSVEILQIGSFRTLVRHHIKMVRYIAKGNSKMALLSRSSWEEVEQNAVWGGRVA
jgi:hypothetical protein